MQQTVERWKRVVHRKGKVVGKFENKKWVGALEPYLSLSPLLS